LQAGRHAEGADHPPLADFLPDCSAAAAAAADPPSAAPRVPGLAGASCRVASVGFLTQVRPIPWWCWGRGRVAGARTLRAIPARPAFPLVVTRHRHAQGLGGFAWRAGARPALQHGGGHTPGVTRAVLAERQAAGRGAAAALRVVLALHGPFGKRSAHASPPSASRSAAANASPNCRRPSSSGEVQGLARRRWQPRYPAQ